MRSNGASSLQWLQPACTAASPLATVADGAAAAGHACGPSSARGRRAASLMPPRSELGKPGLYPACVASGWSARTSFQTCRACKGDTQSPPRRVVVDLVLELLNVPAL